MTLERQLREQLDAAARRLPDPGDHVADVVRRGRRRRAVMRAGAGAAALLLAVAAPAAWRALDPGRIEFEPVAPPPATSSPTASPPAPAPQAVTVGELGAAVLAYGPDDHDQLHRIDRDEEQVLWSGPVDAALPDNRGGVVVQPAGLAQLVWLPDGGDPVPLAEGAGLMQLRALLPDGRLLYSLRPSADVTSEGSVEQFFAVALSEGAEPQPVAATAAHETWTVGPAFTGAGQPLHAGCHLHCSLWPGLAEPPEGAQPLYQGLAIEGLTATPDGRIVAFVEFEVTLDTPAPKLVLLDGTSLDPLALVHLPWDPRDAVGTPVVSLSADGQRVLVTLGSSGPPPVSAPPTTPFLVEGALSADPAVAPVDFAGTLRWFDPVAAVDPDLAAPPLREPRAAAAAGGGEPAAGRHPGNRIRQLPDS